MRQPPPKLLALHQIGVIGGIDIDYQHVHSPNESTYVKLRGNIGTIEGKWDEYKEYLEVVVGFNSVARIKEDYAKQIAEWWMLEEQERKELAEYERLRRKYSSKQNR